MAMERGESLLKKGLLAQSWGAGMYAERYKKGKDNE